MSCDISSRNDLSLHRKSFFSEIRSSPPEVWRMSIYASPKHMRRRNVYDKNHSFWKLIEVEPSKPDVGLVQNIDNLQRKVSIFGSSSSIVDIPSPKKLIRQHIPVERGKSKVGSLCSLHNWSCIAYQRNKKLGFLNHPKNTKKIVDLVYRWSDLCLRECCTEFNSRLFYCLQECCWTKERKSADGLCAHDCCKKQNIEIYENGDYTLLEDVEEGTALGFIRHGPAFRIEDKCLNPVMSGDELCIEKCCLYDNMLIFNAENWFTLSKLGLRKV